MTEPMAIEVISMSSVSDLTAEQALQDAADRLSSMLLKKKKEVEAHIVNEREASNLFHEMQVGALAILRDLFGKEGEGSNFGLSSRILQYERVSYSSGVLFAYWSHQGVPPADAPNLSDPELRGVWRENFYYKGHRWSDIELKHQFYSIFGRLKVALGGVAPVDFFVRQGISKQKVYLRIVGGAENSKIIDDKRVVIGIPTADELRRRIRSTKLANLLAFLDRAKFANRLRGPDYLQFEAQHFERIQGLRDEVDSIIEEIKDKDALRKWARAISSILRSGGGVHFPALDELNLAKIAIGYHYYDIPFDIHMYLPELEKEKRRLVSCLLITTPSGVPWLEKPSLAKGLETLASRLGQYAVIEEQIWHSWGSALPLYWKWKRHYERQANKYERLVEIARSICRSICDKEEIKYDVIACRLKDFDSLFSKMVNRANGRDETCSRAVDYRKWISIGGDKEAEEAFEDLRDIAGIRIICVYNDIEKVKSALFSLKLAKEIDFDEDSDVKDNTTSLGYRSLHITFKLGDRRLKLYGCEDLAGLRCELQIRTILSQGWSNVSHHLVYKTGLPDLAMQEIKAHVGQGLNEKSILLKEIDDRFSEWRDFVRSQINALYPKVR